MVPGESLNTANPNANHRETSVLLPSVSQDQKCPEHRHVLFLLFLFLSCCFSIMFSFQVEEQAPAVWLWATLMLW